jgi:methyl-accepting chemotaxis protein
VGGTDEIGDLSRITAQAFNKVRDFSLSLKKSASNLGGSAEILDQSNTAQNEVITRQAAALQEAQVTAQEIRHTSLLAAQKAEGVLQQTETMEQLGRNGEAAVSRSISSLEEIRGVVTEMATRIKSLDERARQIENITRTVKDLADQSNMLALNAAIEAVRSGEHGKGFGVVAREIRALADQSIKATGRVQQILQDISSAIRSTVAMTDKGVERVGASVEEVRAFGDSMQKLSSIMQDSTAAVRQISAAVSQQNQGITQIFDAIRDLNNVMNDTMVRLNKSSTVTMEVRGVATHVSELIASYGWEKTAWQEKAPDAE